MARFGAPWRVMALQRMARYGAMARYGSLWRAMVRYGVTI